MWGLPKYIMEYAESLPEGTPLCPGALLHLSNRAAIDQALSRLARSGNLLRICQGVYMRPIETRFGQITPHIDKAITALSTLWGETIVPCGGSAANRLGLTTQNPVREVYLTSGYNRCLQFGRHTVELRHAPRWQLMAPHSRAGAVIRALVWLGPNEIEESLEAVWCKLSPDELNELVTARAVLPNWIAEPLSARIAHA